MKFQLISSAFLVLSLELTSAIRPKDGFITTEFKIKNIDS